ncbi:MAG: DUF6792 domain-containing protein, partial [Pseudomonadota bacterium]
MAYNINYAYLSDLVYQVSEADAKTHKEFTDPTTSNTWRVEDFASIENTGYQGAVFVNTQTHEVVLANRGTELGSGRDLLNDLSMGIGKLPSQYESASEFYGTATQIAARYGIQDADITITGHSLGGALSQLLGAAHGNFTQTFNAYGAGNLLDQLGIEQGDFSNIHNQVMDHDFVSILPGSQMIGATTNYKTATDDFHNSAIGQAVAQINNVPLIMHMLLSHSIGNFLRDPSLAEQIGTLIRINAINPITAFLESLHRTTLTLDDLVDAFTQDVLEQSRLRISPLINTLYQSARTFIARR